MSDTSRQEAAGRVLGDLQNVGAAARQTGEQARQTGTQAIDQARDVAQEARERAASVAGTVEAQASSVAEAQKESLAGRLEDVAQAVHRSGEQLEGHQDWIAQIVERGADEMVALARTLRTNDLHSLLGEIGSLARRQPALFVGASMAAGFALARVGRVAAAGAARADMLSGSESGSQLASSEVPQTTFEAPSRPAPMAVDAAPASGPAAVSGRALGSGPGSVPGASSPSGVSYERE